MPVIDLSTGLSPDSELILGIEFDAVLSAPVGLSSNTLNTGFGLSATLQVLVLLQTNDLELGVDIDPDSLLRIDNEANVFLSAGANLGLSIDSDSQINLLLDLQGIFNIGANLQVFGFPNDPEADELNLTVDIFPVTSGPANYQEYKTRFKVNGTEIPINSFSVKAGANKIGTDVTVSLSRLSDKSLILSSSLYTLEIGTVVSGVTTWRTVASGQVTNKSFSIGWDGKGPTDQVTVSTGSSLAQRLNISPLTTLVIYDPNSLSLSVDDFDTIYDVSGNAYPVELVPISGCTLYNILSIALGRAGLSFSCNIPNFKVNRLDINIGQSFFQAVSGLFGAFEPIILERDGVVHIIDSTIMSVSGFSAPKTISPSTFRSLSSSKEFSDINGYIIEYNESATAWDDFNDEVISTVDTVEDIDENRVTSILTDTHVRHYTRRSRPSMTVRDEVFKVITETQVTDPLFYGTEPKLINKTVELFTYDSLGKLLERTKREWARIPIWKPSTNPLSGAGAGKWEYEFEEVRFEKDVSTYADNKYKLGTQYRETLSQIARALVYIDYDSQFETTDITDILDIDPDKEVPIDYKQEYVEAYRAGNLQEPELDSTVSPNEFPFVYKPISQFQPIHARLEKVIPIDKSLSRVETKEIDYLKNIVTVNVAEEQPGEIATSSQTSTSRRAIFIGGGVRDSRRLDSFNIGEIPIEYGLALASRKYARNNFANNTVSAEIIGVDLSLKRGTLVRILGRSSENLGDYLIEGYQIDGKNLGTRDQEFMTTIEAVQT